MKYEHTEKIWHNVLHRALINRNEQTMLSLLNQQTVHFSSLANSTTDKPQHPERHNCLSEDKAILILPVGLEMELKGFSGGMCPIGSKH